MKYLGVPVTSGYLRFSDLDPLDGKFIKNWMLGLVVPILLLADSPLVNAGVSSLPSYSCPFSCWIKLLWKWWISTREGSSGMEKSLRGVTIWWNGVGFVDLREKGGLGVLHLIKQNISILYKCWWKLESQLTFGTILWKSNMWGKNVAKVKSRFNDSPC
jgi:hypothetical protein